MFQIIVLSWWSKEETYLLPAREAEREGRRGEAQRGRREKRQRERGRERTVLRTRACLPWMGGNCARWERERVRKWMGLICLSLRKANITDMLADRR